MIEGGKGGGNTVTGLIFEDALDLVKKFEKIDGYTVQEKQDKALKEIYEVKFQGQLVAELFKKHGLYRYLEYRGVKDSKKILSSNLLPDSALTVIVRETLFIIEMKSQKITGSTDEKLQTCDFKRKQYQKLVKDLGLKVEYVYVLDDWFKKPKYKDVLDYIDSVNCHYKFNELPLAWLGLPNGEEK